MTTQSRRSGEPRPKEEAPVAARPAGMQAINLALYRQIRQAVRELASPPPCVA